VHQSLGQLQLTKVLDDGENPGKYILNLLDYLVFPCSVSFDFHGIVRTSDQSLKFEFGSHHGGVHLLGEKVRKVGLFNTNQIKRLANYVGGMTLDDFETQWLQCHAAEMEYDEESGFQTDRLLVLVCYISPTTTPVEKIFEDII